MSYTVSLQQRIQQLKRLRVDLPKIMDEVCEAATVRAVEATADATPPKAGTGRRIHRQQHHDGRTQGTLADGQSDKASP